MDKKAKKILFNTYWSSNGWKMVYLIQQKYGESCQMRSPLTKKQCEKAHKFLPDDLFEVLKISNGINEVMINPNTNKVEVIGRIIYSLAEMKTQTDCYLGEYGSEGVVFAGNGTGGFRVIFVMPEKGRWNYAKNKRCDRKSK